MLNTKSPLIDQAQAVLRVEGDPDFLAQIDRAVAAGARWIVDPHYREDRKSVV